MRNFISAKRHVTCETVNKSFWQNRAENWGVGSLFFCLLKGQRHLKTKHIQQVMEYAVTCFFMDFSLLSPLEFFVVPKNGDGRNNKPPAMRVRVDCYTKNHLSVYNRVVQAVLQKGKVIYGEERKFTCAYEMDVQISYRLHT